MKFGVLVLSSDSDPWRSVIESGARKTWMNNAQVPILEYVATPGTDSKSARYACSLLESQRRNPLKHMLGIAARSLWIRQENISRGLLNSCSYSGEILSSTSANKIQFDFPNSTSFLGVRTVFALAHLMETQPDLDFIIRTNVSSYLNLEATENWLRDKPRYGFYCGPSLGRQLPIRFAGGSFIAMSRDVARFISQATGGATLFPMVDDVFIGARLSKAGFSVQHHESIVLPNVALVDSLVDPDFRSEPHFRCKGFDGIKRTDVEIMHALHQKLKS